MTESSSGMSLRRLAEGYEVQVYLFAGRGCSPEHSNMSECHLLSLLKRNADQIPRLADQKVVLGRRHEEVNAGWDVR